MSSNNDSNCSGDEFQDYNFNENVVKKLRHELQRIKKNADKPADSINFTELCCCCYRIVSSVPFPTFMVNSGQIWRARENYNNETFSEEWELSYNSTDIDIITTNRFNLMKEPMFYGSMSFIKNFEAIPNIIQETNSTNLTFLQNSHLLVTVARECSKKLADINDGTSCIYLTYGKFFVEGSFPVVLLCFDEKVLQYNPTIKRIVDGYKDKISTSVNSHSAELIIDCWKFFTELSCKGTVNRQEYFISTAFCHALKFCYDNHFNGILYPSSMTDSEGLNIVLQPKAVRKFLKLKEVFMVKFNKKEMDNGLRKVIQCTDIAYVYDCKFNLVQRNGY